MSGEMTDDAGEGSQLLPNPPPLPFPIFRLSSLRPRYMLYDIDTVSWLRREQHILGVAIGGMPQFPQQNVFFGLPLELMPEEVRLLTEKGIAFICDDFEEHRAIMDGMSLGQAESLQRAKEYEQENSDIAQHAKDEAAKAKKEATERIWEQKGLTIRPKKTAVEPSFNAARLPVFSNTDDQGETATILFDDRPAPHDSRELDRDEPSWSLTPTTSKALMPPSSLPVSSQPVIVPDGRYHVFKELHDRGYYMTPGLRFGCQFTAYPGDPLRFHSHFLATGAEWDEEFDLLDVVGGGRLGTGVKKGYLFGGKQTEGDRSGETRTFCIEWAGM